MAGVQQVFLDKTGTLTEDRVELRQTQLLSHSLVSSTEDALRRAAALAAWSSHPLSRALVAAQAQVESEAATAFSEAADPWHQVVETPGAGVQARDAQGRKWRLGASAWAVGGKGGESENRLPPGEHSVLLACDGEAVAAFGFEEFVREGAPQAVQRLEAAGLQLSLLSGDAPVRAQALAQRLGLKDCHAGLSPEDKLVRLQRAQSEGRRVAMVGDGLNDAPVIAAADVSVAMGHGALVSREDADAVIVSGRLDALADLHSTSRRTMAIVQQNMRWAVIYNATCIPLALAGWLPPWAAGLGMAASSLLVMLNAQRAGSSASCGVHR